jgi:hypothetical protein
VYCSGGIVDEVPGKQRGYSEVEEGVMADKRGNERMIAERNMK